MIQFQHPGDGPRLATCEDICVLSLHDKREVNAGQYCPAFSLHTLCRLTTTCDQQASLHSSIDQSGFDVPLAQSVLVWGVPSSAARPNPPTVKNAPEPDYSVILTYNVIPTYDVITFYSVIPLLFSLHRRLSSP